MGVKTPPRLRFCGDTLLLVEIDARIDPAVNAQVMRVAGRLGAERLAGVRDIVPAYGCVGIHFDPLLTDLAALEQTAVEAAADTATEAPVTPRVVQIPVCYGGAHGPDLDDVARWASMTPDEVVRRHVERTYRVYMLGFLPGFAYMATVDAAIAIARHRTPRERVPAGSVGIAGEQTGVYPAETPGGWHLIGQTPFRMFNPGASAPSRCQPGDDVRFIRISAGEFSELALSADGTGSAS